LKLHLIAKLCISRVKNRSALTPGKKKYPPPRTVTKAGTGCSRCATPFVLHEFELPADIGIQADEFQAALGIRTVRLHRCLGIDPVTELAAALKDAVKPTRLYEVRPQIGPLQSERANEAPDRTSCRPPGMSAVRGFARRTCAPNG